MIRLAKIALTGASALFLFLVVLNNLTDYGSNLLFVQHVLAMDTTFEGNALRWRAIESPLVHHAFYASIILWETVTLVLIGMGTAKLWQARRAPGPEWQAAKRLAIVGLVAGLLQWYVAFLAVGGEWFAMWQSRTWNGQDAAARMFLVMGLSLLFLAQREPDEAA